MMQEMDSLKHINPSTFEGKRGSPAVEIFEIQLANDMHRCSLHGFKVRKRSNNRYPFVTLQLKWKGNSRIGIKLKWFYDAYCN